MMEQVKSRTNSATPTETGNKNPDIKKSYVHSLLIQIIGRQLVSMAHQGKPEGPIPPFFKKRCSSNNHMMLKSPSTIQDEGVLPSYLEDSKHLPMRPKQESHTPAEASQGSSHLSKQGISNLHSTTSPKLQINQHLMYSNGQNPNTSSTYHQMFTAHQVRVNSQPSSQVRHASEIQARQSNQQTLQSA